MTEVFYIAVKGSLHAGDSSVFGIKSEEYSALCRRFPDSNKQVINGVLIKGSPLEVINSLAELGYRVTCSSGETEIVWTLRREALPGEKLVSPITSPQATPPLQVVGRPFVVQPSMTRAPVKTVERIGTKPEDWQELNSIQESDRITTRHISSLERVDPGQKIILKTNLSSEFNPLSKRPGPVPTADCHEQHHGGPQRSKKRSHSLPPLSGSGRKHVHPKPSLLDYKDDDWSYKPRNYNCYHVKGTNVILRKREKTPLRREGLKIYLEDVYTSDGETFTKRKAFTTNRRDLFKSLFMPLGGNSEGIVGDSNERDAITFFEKRVQSGDVNIQSASDMCQSPFLHFTSSNVSFHKSGAKQSLYSEPISCSTSFGPTFTMEDELSSSFAKTYPQQRMIHNTQHYLSKSGVSNCELLRIIPSDDSADCKTEQQNQLEVLTSIEQSVEMINDSCGLLMKTDESADLCDTHSLPSKDDRRIKSFPSSNGKRCHSHRVQNVTNDSEATTFSLIGIPTTPEASYPDLTLSDFSAKPSDNTHLLRSGDSTHKNTFSSRTICPHGFILSDLPFTENTYQVRNVGSTTPPRMESAIHEPPPSSSSEHKLIRCERQCVPSGNSSGVLSESTKQIRRCCQTADTSNISQPLSSTLGVLQLLLKDKADSEKLEDLDETDWSVISSLVDELFKNKRKRRKRMPLTEELNLRR